MKKALSLIMLLVVSVLILAPAAKAYACECKCDACKNCKEKETKKTTAKEKMEKETKKLLKQIKKVAKENGWVIETEVKKSTKKELITTVKITNPEKRMHMDEMEIRSKKSNGVYVADWYFYKESEQTWKHTTSERINKVLASD